MNVAMTILAVWGALLPDSAESCTVWSASGVARVATAGGGPCTVDGDCDDGSVCTGVESCVDDICTPGTPLDCDDLNPCTDDTCDALTGCAQHTERRQSMSRRQRMYHRGVLCWCL